MDVSRLVRTHITTSDLDPPAELVNGINDASVQLLALVKALGEYLTSTEDDVRLKGLTFLSNVVKVILPTRFTRQATQTLTQYYIAKLDDFDSLPPALQALTVLSKLPTFDDDAAVEVYQGVVKDVNLKAYVQATRHLVFVLLDSLLATHRNALKGMEGDFLQSYTKMVEGEKDPRNLLLLFSMDRIILLEFAYIDEYIEDFFDITFCYFPIAFKPPPNDPYGITADDLKLALRGCMSASPYFAKMAIPLFLEKFATARGEAMKDLMLSMAACLPVYGGEAVRERGTELWEGIKTEIMYSSDTAIETAALAVLEALIRTLYPIEAEPPTGLAQDIIKECLIILEEPEKTQGLASTKILAALVRSSPSAGKFALSQTLPQLFRKFNRPASPSHRTPILSAISTLLLAAKSVHVAPDTSRHQSEEKSLEAYREPLLDTLREGLRTESLKLPAIRGSVALVEIPGFWGKDEVEDVVRGMNDILVNDTDPETRSAVIKGLTTVSKLYSSIVESLTLPLLFHNLPDQAPPVSDIAGREKYRSILSSLVELCVLPALFETLVIRIISKLDHLSSSGQEGEVDTRDCNLSYGWDLLNCLSEVIDRKLKLKHVDTVKYFDQLIPRLYGLVIVAAVPVAGGNAPLFADRRLLSSVGRISETLLWESTVERQTKHFEAVYKAFEQGDMAGIVYDTDKVKASGAPMRVGASTSEQDLVAIYSSTVQGLKAEVALPFPSAIDYLTSKMHWTIHTASNDFQVRHALDLITAFVNKRVKDLEQALESVLEAVWINEVIDTSVDYQTRRRGLLVYLHIIKALALLQHPSAYSGLTRVIDSFTLSSFDPQFVNEAARGFGVLAEGKGKGKEKISNLTAKLLFAQKLWNFILPKLIEGDQNTTGKGRLVYLVAFSSLLPLVPSSLCLSDLPLLLPLLLRSLSLPDPSQRINAITTLTSILETRNMSSEVDTLLHQQAETIVEGLLKSALPDPSGDMQSSGKVRAEALKCLSLVPDAMRFDRIRGMKAGVVKDLGRALDDPLRIVRKEAVECRAKWYRYGGTT